MTDKNKIEQFKRDLKSLTFYKGRLKELNDELQRLDRIMHEAKTVKYGEVVRSTNKKNYLDLMDQEDKCKEKKNFYKVLVDRMDIKLVEIKNENLMLYNMIVDMYIKEKNHEYLAGKYYYATRQGMYRRIEKDLAEFLYDW